MGGMIEYQADEIVASGYLATPKSGSVPSTLVIHAWWGLNSSFKSLCDRLAQEGFVVSLLICMEEKSQKPLKSQTIAGSDGFSTGQNSSH